MVGFFFMIYTHSNAYDEGKLFSFCLNSNLRVSENVSRD